MIVNGEHYTYRRGTGKHNFQGSLTRHIAVEECFNFLAKPTSLIFRILKKERLYKFARIPYVIVWGLNCNFPVRDVGLYVIYWLKQVRIPRT